MEKEIYFEVQVLCASSYRPRSFDVKDLRTGEVFHNVLPDYIKRESPEFLNAHSIIKNPENMRGLYGTYKFVRGWEEKENVLSYDKAPIEVFNEAVYTVF